MSEAFKAITTQEEFDEAIKLRLKREKEEIEGLQAEVARLTTTNAELTKQAETYSTDLSERDAKIAGYETANLRTRIALQHGLPYDMASRLVGDDEASIKADAEALVALVGKGNKQVPPLRTTEPLAVDGKETAYKSLLENLNLEGE